MVRRGLVIRAHLTLRLTQGAAQFLQHGAGLRRLAQLRLQQTLPGTIGNPLLSDLIVQFTNHKLGGLGQLGLSFSTVG